MVTCSNGDKFNLKWIVSFISNGDTIKWWHFWFDKNKRIYFKWWHDQMVTYLVWNEMENNNRFFIPLAVWILYSLIFLHNTCQACYRLLKLVTMKIRYHKMVTAKSQSAFRKWNSSAPACCKLFIIITGNYEHPYIVDIKMVNTKSKQLSGHKTLFNVMIKTNIA